MHSGLCKCTAVHLQCSGVHCSSVAAVHRGPWWLGGKRGQAAMPQRRQQQVLEALGAVQFALQCSEVLHRELQRCCCSVQCTRGSQTANAVGYRASAEA